MKQFNKKLLIFGLTLASSNLLLANDCQTVIDGDVDLTGVVRLQGAAAYQDSLAKNTVGSVEHARIDGNVTTNGIADNQFAVAANNSVATNSVASVIGQGNRKECN
jgi:hypothetical protein